VSDCEELVGVNHRRWWGWSCRGKNYEGLFFIKYTCFWKWFKLSLLFCISIHIL